MNIKHGDIITLENGDTAEVSLKIIAKKVTELIVNKKYLLSDNGQFCHTATTSEKYFIGDIKKLEFTYVGRITTNAGERHIFYSVGGESVYGMWSTDTLNFVVREIK
jgi:hypothetical protein